MTSVPRRFSIENQRSDLLVRFARRRAVYILGRVSEAHEERLAKNENLFRALNENIVEIAGSLGDDTPYEFVCECSTKDCFERIPVGDHLLDLDVLVTVRTARISCWPRVTRTSRSSK
jgi:hypothetical protein